MVVWYWWEARAWLRLAVRRRCLCSSCQVIQPNAIGVCTGSSSPSAASALGLFFVALLTLRISSRHVPKSVRDSYLDLAGLALKTAIPGIVMLAIAPLAYRILV